MHPQEKAFLLSLAIGLVLLAGMLAVSLEGGSETAQAPTSSGVGISPSGLGLQVGAVTVPFSGGSPSFGVGID